MFIADIPTTSVAVKVIKRVLPVRPLLCQYQRRVSCTALLCNWPPCVPYDHPTIFSLNKCIYNTHTRTHKDIYIHKTCFLQQNKQYWSKIITWNVQSVMDMRVSKGWRYGKDKEKREREKKNWWVWSKTWHYGLDCLSLNVSTGEVFAERERQRESVGESVCVYIWDLLAWHTKFTVLGQCLIVAFWRKYPFVLLWRWRYSLTPSFLLKKKKDIP